MSYFILISIIILQWILLSFLLADQQGSTTIQQSADLPSRLFHQLAEYSSQHQIITNDVNRTTSDVTDITTPVNHPSPEKWTGVAATLALHSPKWFHRRYTNMIQNIIANTPESYVVQVFINPTWWNNEIHKFHRGMLSLEQHPRVNITKLPQHLATLKKPKLIMTNRFIWENLLHDRVFFFSGNGVRCANSIASWDAFDGIDFLGAPSKIYKGGDVMAHSIRNRQAMLEVIDFKKGDAGESTETHYFSTGLEELNKKTPAKYRVGTYQEQILFAGGAELVSQNNTLRENAEQFGPSLVMSGIETDIPWAVREQLLMLCPEWKVIFPSLHEPHCFGAHPDASKCAATLCALNPDKPKTGC
jgi:hypothetical protein